MNNQQSTALLFVSNRCGHSRQFVQELRQLGASAAVHQINIDTTPRERIPSVVRSVPTLILNTAGQQTVLVGDQAFVWLNTQKQYSQQPSQQQSRPQMAHRSGQSAHPSGAAAGPASGGNAPAATNGEPQAWHSTEMGASFSDTYSFIDNSFTENGNGARPTGSGSGTGGGSTIPKAFAYLSASPMDVQNPQQPAVYAAPQSHSRPQQQQQQQQPQQQAYQRQNMPSGQGSFTPNATMAPPTQNNSGYGNMGSGFGNSHSGGQATDELTKRLEQLRTARENDMPNQIARIS